MKNLVIVLSLIHLLVGCSTVLTQHPIGTEHYFTSKKEWEGSWLIDDGIIKIKVINESTGAIKLAWIEEKNDDFKLETATCQLMKSQSGIYINSMDIPGEDFGGYYIWGKIQMKDNRILIWPPSFDSFKSAYTDKKIKAVVESNFNQKSQTQEITKIKLVDDPTVILKLIEDNKNSFFDWENPIILKRFSDD